MPDNREFKRFDASLVKPGDLPVPADKETPSVSEKPSEIEPPEEGAGQGLFNVAPGLKEAQSKDLGGFTSVKGTAYYGRDEKPYQDPCPRSQTMDKGACRPMTTAEAAKSEADFAQMRKEGKIAAPAPGCPRGQRVAAVGGCRQMNAEEAAAYEGEFNKARKEGKVRSFEEFERMKLAEEVKKGPGREARGKTEYPERGGTRRGVPPEKRQQLEDGSYNVYNYVANGIETVGGRQIVHLRGTDGKWYQTELPPELQGKIANGKKLSYDVLRLSGLTVTPREALPQGRVPNDLNALVDEAIIDRNLKK